MLAYRCTCVDGEVVTVLVADGEPRIVSRNDVIVRHDADARVSEMTGAMHVERRDGAVVLEDVVKIEIRRAP